MSKKILSNELFLQTVVSLFEPKEIEQIAQYLLERLDKKSLTALNDDAEKNNLTNYEFLALLMKEKLTGLNTDLLTENENESFKNLSKYIN